MSRPTVYRAIGALILFVSALWSGYALFAEAPVVDESPHLAAGISYVELLDYRLNPEHPPLEKLAAGLVAGLADPKLPTSSDWWPSGINEQWRAGTEVLWDGNNDPGTILALGRLGVLALNFFFLVLGWRVLSKKYGESWGLAFLSLTALSPFFLGHGHLVTTDVTAASVAMLACITFASWLKQPTQRTFAIAALCFGVAQLAKFSMILLIPTFAIAALVIAYQKYGRAWRELGRHLLKACAVMFAGFVLVVYPTYLALTWNGSTEKQERDTTFLLSSFAGGPTKGMICNPLRCVANLTIVASRHELTRPASTYMLGVLMVTQRSRGGNSTYFDGIVSSSGSAFYFPLVYLTKETIPALLFVSFGLAFFLWRMRGSLRDIGKNATPELVLGIFVALYLASTFKSSLNIGIRHLFPVLPVLYLFALIGWRNETKVRTHAHYVLGGLLIVNAAVCLSSLPYPLAYYNQLGGGTARGYEIAADSNYDWGQDALRLRQWMDAHPDEKVAVDLFGGSDAEPLLGANALSWPSSFGNPEVQGIRYFAVSVNRLLNQTGHLIPGEPRSVVNEYRWLSTMRGTTYGEVPEPDERAGTSIFIYKLN